MQSAHLGPGPGGKSWAAEIVDTEVDEIKNGIEIAKKKGWTLDVASLEAMLPGGPDLFIRWAEVPQGLGRPYTIPGWVGRYTIVQEPLNDNVRTAPVRIPSPEPSTKAKEGS